MSKKLVDKRNKQIHKVVLVLRDPMIMTFLGMQLTRVWNERVGREPVKVNYAIDLFLLAWAAKQDYFKKKSFQDAINDIDPYFLPDIKFSKAEAILGRLKRQGYLNRAVYKGSKTWFITPKGKLFIIDVTNDIRKVVTMLLTKAKTPYGMRRPRKIKGFS